MFNLLRRNLTYKKVNPLVTPMMSHQNLRQRHFSFQLHDEPQIFYEQQEAHKTEYHKKYIEELQKKFKIATRHKIPKLFISYSWFIHNLFPQENWVQPFLAGFYQDLRRIGFKVDLDIYDSRAGCDMVSFMKAGIKESDFVIIVGTHTLREKVSDPNKNYAVKVEYREIKELLNQDNNIHNGTKVIPIQLTGVDWKDAFPSDLFTAQLAVEEVTNGKLFTYSMFLEFITLTILKRFCLKEKITVDDSIEQDLVRNIISQTDLHSKLTIRSIQQILQTNYKKLTANQLFYNNKSYISAQEEFFDMQFESAKHIIINEPELFDWSIAPHGQNRRLYIQGVSGVGKSTWCKKIANHWAHKSILLNFDLVILVHLDELKNYSEMNYNKNSDVFSEGDLWCFLFNISKTQIYLAHEIMNRVNQPSIRTLYVLDNYDAVSRLSQKHPLYACLKNLLLKTNFIITGNMVHVNLMNSVRHLKLLGIHPNKSKTYFKNCLLQYHLSQSENEHRCNLVDRLFQSDHELMDLANNPMFLQIIAELFTEQEIFKKNINIKMSDIYNKLVDKLIHRWCSLETESLNGVALIASHENTLIKSFLQAIAQAMYNNGNFTIAFDAILNIYKKSYSELPQKYIDGLRNSGLLMPVNNPLNTVDQYWSFIHNNIASYLIAKAVEVNILNQCPNTVFENSLQNYPLLPSTKQIWRFICYSSHSQPNIFNYLLDCMRHIAFKRDNHLFKKFELFAILMNETIDNSQQLSQIQKKILNFIKDFITWMMLKYRSNASSKTSSPFHYILKENISLLRHPEIIDHLLSLLASKFLSEDVDQTDGLIFIIGEWKLADPLILRQLINLLKDKRWYVRAEAARALGKIGQGHDSVIAGLTDTLKNYGYNEKADAAKALGILKVNQPHILLLLVKEFNAEQSSGWRSAIVSALAEYYSAYPELFAQLNISLKSPRWEKNTTLLMDLIKIYPFDRDIIVALFDNIFDQKPFIYDGGKKEHTGMSRVDFIELISNANSTYKNKLYQVAGEMINNPRSLSEARFGIWLMAFLRIYIQQTTSLLLKIMNDEKELRIMAEALWAIGYLSLNDHAVQQKVCQLTSHADDFVRYGTLLAIMGSNCFSASYQYTLQERLKKETEPRLIELLNEAIEKQKKLFNSMVSLDEKTDSNDNLIENNQYEIPLKKAIVTHQYLSEEKKLLKQYSTTNSNPLIAVKTTIQKDRTDKTLFHDNELQKILLDNNLNAISNYLNDGLTDYNIDSYIGTLKELFQNSKTISTKNQLNYDFDKLFDTLLVKALEHEEWERNGWFVSAQAAEFLSKINYKSCRVVDAIVYVLTKKIDYVYYTSSEQELAKRSAAKALSSMCFEFNYAFDAFIEHYKILQYHNILFYHELKLSHAEVTSDKLNILKQLLQLLNHHDSTMNRIPTLMLSHISLQRYAYLLTTEVDICTNIKSLLIIYKPADIISAFSISHTNIEEFEAILEQAELITLNKGSLQFYTILNTICSKQIDLNASYNAAISYPDASNPARFFSASKPINSLSVNRNRQSKDQDSINMPKSKL